MVCRDMAGVWLLCALCMASLILNLIRQEQYVQSQDPAHLCTQEMLYIAFN